MLPPNKSLCQSFKEALQYLASCAVLCNWYIYSNSTKSPALYVHSVEQNPFIQNSKKNCSDDKSISQVLFGIS